LKDPPRCFTVHPLRMQNFSPIRPKHQGGNFSLLTSAAMLNSVGERKSEVSLSAFPPEVDLPRGAGAGVETPPGSSDSPATSAKTPSKPESEPDMAQRKNKACLKLRCSDHCRLCSHRNAHNSNDQASSRSDGYDAKEGFACECNLPELSSQSKASICRSLFAKNVFVHNSHKCQYIRSDVSLNTIRAQFTRQSFVACPGKHYSCMYRA
jgi:hypothetical protein